MILLETHAGDDHLAPVRAGLEHRGHEVAVLDSGRYPSATNLTVNYDEGDLPHLELTTDGTRHDLDTCRAAWWRRPRPYDIPDDVTDPAARAFAFSECDEALQGLRALLRVSWLNDPTRDARACRKAYQLREARRAGLTTPRTVFTNDPDVARAFVREQGVDRTVYKAFLAQHGAWRETRVLRGSEVEQLDLVRHAPVIFQEYVEGDLDLRVTVVGDVVHAAAIHSAATDYATDYRLEIETVAMAPYRLPDEVHRRLIRFMRRIGLVYGAVDFRLRADGELVFFEVNPSGQWLFIEERTGLPITDAVVGTLSAADRGAPHPRSAPSGCQDCEQNVPGGGDRRLALTR